VTRLRWSEPASRDFLGILEWIKARNPPAAAKVGRHILDGVEGLVDHPFMGKPGRSPNTREFVTTSYPYLIVYGVEPDNDARINKRPLTSSACSTALCDGRRRPRKALRRAVHFRRLPAADAGLTLEGRRPLQAKIHSTIRAARSPG
jgi:toxin ParE1/3/4